MHVWAMWWFRARIRAWCRWGRSRSLRRGLGSLTLLGRGSSNCRTLSSPADTSCPVYANTAASGPWDRRRSRSGQQTGAGGGTKLLKVALVLSTLPCRARIAKRPSNQVRRSPARRPMTGGFAGSFTLVRTWATRAYGREDRRCEWRTACAVPTSRIGVL